MLNKGAERSRFINYVNGQDRIAARRVHMTLMWPGCRFGPDSRSLFATGSAGCCVRPFGAVAGWPIFGAEMRNAKVGARTGLRAGLLAVAFAAASALPLCSGSSSAQQAPTPEAQPHGAW